MLVTHPHYQLLQSLVSGGIFAVTGTGPASDVRNLLAIVGKIVGK